MGVRARASHLELAEPELGHREHGGFAEPGEVVMASSAAAANATASAVLKEASCLTSLNALHVVSGGAYSKIRKSA